jgi:hypothetical protein
MSKDSELRRDEWCLDYSEGQAGIGKNDTLFMLTCDRSELQKWSYKDDLLRHIASGLCIELAPDKNGVFMHACDKNNVNQIWRWRRRELIVGDGQIL